MTDNNKDNAIAGNEEQDLQDRLNQVMQRKHEPVTSARREMPVIDYNKYARKANEKIVKDQKLATSLHKRQRVERIPHELNEWQNKVTGLYRSAALNNIDSPEMRAFLSDNIKRFKYNTETDNGQKSIILVGGNGSGKTFAAYAFAYELLALGYLKADQIKIINETTLSEIANSGYNKQEQLEELLNPKYKFYFIDEVGRATYRAQDQRANIWFSLLDHIGNYKLTAVLATNLVAKKPTNAGSHSTTAPTIAEWLGKAGADRLRALVGSAMMNAGVVDRRAELAQKQEQAYAKQKNRNA